MNKGLKYTLITLGVIGTGVGLFFIFRKGKDENIEGPVLNRPSNNNSGGGLFGGNDDWPLKRGSKGANVRSLQSCLNTTFGESLSVDGDFGPLTETAANKHFGSKTITSTSYGSKCSTSGSVMPVIDADNDGIPDTIDIDGGTGTGISPVVPVNTGTLPPYLYNIPSYGQKAFNGLNENIVIDGNTITNTDERSPGYDNSCERRGWACENW
jgi:hypothetical protein